MSKIKDELLINSSQIGIIENEPLSQLIPFPDLQITILGNRSEANQPFVNDWLYCQKNGIDSLLFAKKDTWVPDKFKSITVNYSEESIDEDLKRLLSTVKQVDSANNKKKKWRLLWGFLIF